EYSKAGEFVYDHPFLWGSKRTGPDLHRIGGEYPGSWHYTHMLDPRAVSTGSIMPAYPWMIEDAMDVSTLETKINALRTLGVPYPKGYEKEALQDLIKQAESIQANLAKEGIEVKSDREIIAMIAYLQRLGTDIKGIPQEDLPRK
ncbi:MAG: cbb3-type cytochrome c oxidase subunit II, partial [Bacteroidota bacterium]